MSIAIAPMETRHLPALAKLERECFADPWSEATLAEELGKGIFLVAEDGDSVVGYIGCQTVLDEGYITNIAVTPHRRRQGIGQALLACLLEEASVRGLAFVTLEVRVSNTPAIALYKSVGFVLVGTRPGFYDHPKETAFLLTRFLTEKGDARV